MKQKKLFFLTLLAVILLAAIFVVPVFAQGETPPPATGGVAELNAEFLAFLVALTGFFKKQFNLEGKIVLGVAFVVGLFLYFSPLLAFGDAVTQVVDFVKWFLAGAGSIDVATSLLSKVGRKATP